MTFPYSTQLDPPALVVPVQVSGLLRDERVSIDAKIDTAADASGIPIDLVERLGLVSSGFMDTMTSFERQYRRRPFYYVSIFLPDGRVYDVRTLSIPRNYVLLGRDVLNECILTANGPELRFDLD